MSKFKFIVLIAVISSLLFGVPALAAASTSAPYSHVLDESPHMGSIVQDALKIPRTSSGTIDWDAYTTYDRETDTCCCSGYAEPEDETDEADKTKKDDKTDETGEADEPDVTGKPDKGDKPDKPDKGDKPDNPNEPDEPDKLDKGDEPDKDKDDEPNEPGEPDKPYKPGKPGKPGKPDKVDEPDDACKNFCPDCGDCIDCGTDPCPTCCDDGRRCGRCPLCVPVTLSDTTHQYNGSVIDFTGATLNSPVNTINYYFTALSDEAELNDGLPYRVGKYMVTAVFSSRAVSSGTLTAIMTITPAPLEVGNIAVNNKVYNATSKASYVRESINDFTLNGIFGNDNVELSNHGAPYFSSIYADKAIPVNFIGFELGGEHAWNYYVTHPTGVTADIIPAPVTINIELSEKTYDMTKEAVIKSVSEPFGVFIANGVPDDVRLGEWGDGTYASPYPDTAIPVSFSGFELVGEHADNYYVDASDKIGVINQAPLALKVIYDETKTYDKTIDVNVEDIVLDGMIEGDDIELDAIGDLFYTSPDAEESIPLEITEFTIKGSSFDYYNITYPSDLVADITRAPLTIKVELVDRVYDGTTDAALKSVTLTGVLDGDDVELDELGIPTLISPDAGINVPLSFTDFTIRGEQADNYYLIQPTDAISLITRAPIGVWINEDDLKIGGVLDFGATEDTSGWDIQWYADGEPIPGANGETYTIQPGDPDKEISVRLVSPDGNKEGEAAPTAPVPYTIILAISGSTEPMGSDNVYFGSPGNMTAYAASRNNGSVSISYSLYSSGYTSDRLNFSTGISGITKSGSGFAKYFASPAHAENGVITITATFYHVGITVSPTDAHTFAEVECNDSLSDEVRLITVDHVGNYAAENISYSISGSHPSAFQLDKPGCPSIGAGGSDTFAIQPDADNAPPLAEGKLTYSATVTVSYDGVTVASIPVTVDIHHTFGDFIYYPSGHYHDRSCIGCDRYFKGNCTYNTWRLEGSAHVRNCTVCLGKNPHTPDWNVWSQGSATEHTHACKLCNLSASANHTWGAWGQGNSSQHTRSCTACSRTNSANHTWANRDATYHRCPTCNLDAAHTWGSWSSWGQGDANNHSRTRTCTTTGCGRVDTGTAAHTWGSWGQGDSTQHTRTCTTCSRSASANHTWGSWSAWAQGNATNHTRTRTCTACNRSESASAEHTWGSWGQGNATQHTRTCTACSRTNTANHTWANRDATYHRCPTCNRDAAHTWGSWSSWGQGDATNHTRTRTCTTTGCGRVDTGTAAHTWGAWGQGNATQHTRTCTTCSRSASANHTWGSWSTWDSVNATNHRRTRTCTATGCGRTDTETVAHTWGAWGAWSSVNATNHRRTRTCTANGCDRTDTETVAHTWGKWGAWGEVSATNHRRTRTCTANGCDRTENETVAHTWGSWSAWTQGDATNHTAFRSCTACGRGDSTYSVHTWGGWTQGDSSNHSRSCTGCGRVSYSSHTWGSWNKGTSSGHVRYCTVCSRSTSASHSTSWKMYSSTQCAPYCSTCGYWGSASSHVFGKSVYSQGGYSSQCSRCGYVRFQTASIIIGPVPDPVDPVDPYDPDDDPYGPGYDPALDLPQFPDPCRCGCDGGCFDCYNCADCEPACKTCDFCEGCRPINYHCHDCCDCDCDLSLPVSYPEPDPVNPDDPGDTGDLDDPDDPDDPGDTGEPDDPGDTGEPDDPGDTGEPDDPDKPGEPDDTDEPGEPDDPNDPGEPDDPDDPGEPDDPDDPGEPDDPDDPGEPDDTDDVLPQAPDPCSCGCDAGCFDCGNCADCKPVCKTCDLCEGCRPVNYHCHDCCECDCDLDPPGEYKEPEPDPEPVPEPEPGPSSPPPFQPPVNPIAPITPVVPIVPITPIFPPML